MRGAVLLLVVAALVLAAAWNANQLFDAIAAFYSYPPARRLLVWTLALIAAGLAIAALILISRRAYQQLDRDFPNTFDN